MTTNASSIFTENPVKIEKLVLTKLRGFCAGVVRAIDIVEKALEVCGRPVYVRHEIIHNRYVVDDLRAKGAVFVEEFKDVPEGVWMIYSAHGVSPQVRDEAKAKKFKVIDATCPLVTKVHLEAIQLAKEGYTIILIGHEEHVETIGTMGEAPDHIRVVGTSAEAETVQVPDPTKVAYLTQTTLSLDDTAEIVQALKKRFPALAVPKKSDICYATQNRQNAVKALVDRIDLLLVIGSKNSSNSNRLVEVARSHGVAAHLVDEPDEIDPAWLDGVTIVGLTAGASAPEDLVQATVQHLLAARGGTVEPFLLKEERVEFPLPKELASA